MFMIRGQSAAYVANAVHYSLSQRAMYKLSNHRKSARDDQAIKPAYIASASRRRSSVRYKSSHSDAIQNPP
ncbi:hypothetical protein PGT21_027722 [Puccinia graminis f. sp. tritici]|uniref:Uncharacterized protein n=1 Tax=Puccinia graminis f. sp. tritici TaxID=56615 RepID=A0A5B0M4L9_PUCGR|nr:hypothetical protein PGT21_027722 [Puccinia graminis f. sp. tritici]